MTRQPSKSSNCLARIQKATYAKAKTNPDSFGATIKQRKKKATQSFSPEPKEFEYQISFSEKEITEDDVDQGDVLVTMKKYNDVQDKTDVHHLQEGEEMFPDFDQESLSSDYDKADILVVSKLVRWFSNYYVHKDEAYLIKALSLYCPQPGRPHFQYNFDGALAGLIAHRLVRSKLQHELALSPEEAKSASDLYNLYNQWKTEHDIEPYPKKLAGLIDGLTNYLEKFYQTSKSFQFNPMDFGTAEAACAYNRGLFYSTGDFAYLRTIVFGYAYAIQYRDAIHGRGGEANIDVSLRDMTNAFIHLTQAHEHRVLEVLNKLTEEDRLPGSLRYIISTQVERAIATSSGEHITMDKLSGQVVRKTTKASRLFQQTARTRKLKGKINWSPDELKSLQSPSTLKEASKENYGHLTRAERIKRVHTRKERKEKERELEVKPPKLRHNPGK